MYHALSPLSRGEGCCGTRVHVKARILNLIRIRIRPVLGVLIQLSRLRIRFCIRSRISGSRECVT